MKKTINHPSGEMVIMRKDGTLDDSHLLEDDEDPTAPHVIMRNSQRIIAYAEQLNRELELRELSKKIEEINSKELNRK